LSEVPDKARVLDVLILDLVESVSLFLTGILSISLESGSFLPFTGFLVALEVVSDFSFGRTEDGFEDLVGELDDLVGESEDRAFVGDGGRLSWTLE
jgi:hypothetical protein